MAMISTTIPMPAACPICASQHMAWVKRLPIKVGGSVDLYYCMECESFSSPFSRPMVNPPTQVQWHQQVLERNLGWSAMLLDEFSSRQLRGPIVDIGCGIGSLLLAAQRRGIPGIGYDLDAEACAHGREQYGLDLRCGLWQPEQTPTFSVLTCISVLEHIHQPRALIQDMLRAARLAGASVYLSVPFFNRAWWRHLHDDSSLPGHPLEYPHAHCTHFSNRGMEAVLREFGARDLEMLKIDRGWVGYLVTA